MLSILGINTNLPNLTEEEKNLVKSWQNARKEKNFELADKIRTELDSKGIILNDTVNGTTWDIKELY